MGRSRWLCYGLNEERRRQEQEEREGRPGARPVSNGQGHIKRENFHIYRILGRGRAILTCLDHTSKYVGGWCILGLYREWQLGLVRSCMDQGKTMSDCTYQAHREWDQPVDGMGINLQRPHLAGPPALSTPSPCSNSRRRC